MPTWIETDAARAQTSLMAAVAAAKRPSPSRGPLHRGVTLQKTSAPTRFSVAQLKKAVETAVAKNADALSG